MMERSDNELILGAQQGEQEALEMLFHRYKKSVFNFSFRIVGNRADAEDVTAEVFLVLFTKSYLYKPQAQFSTWLFTVTRNTCITKIRKNKRLVSLWFESSSDDKYEEWDIADTKALPSQELAQKELAQQVRRLIAKLPEPQKSALILREYNGFSYVQISEVLGCSLDNVKVLIFRAREQLKDDLTSFMTEEHDDRT